MSSHPDPKPIVFWHDEHVYFNQLLEQLRRQLDRFHRDEQPNYELMQDIVSYLREYGDRFHHPREDEAFRRLTTRCPDLQLPLARLQQEHRVIAHAGEMLLERLSAIRDGAILPRAEVEMAAATYLVYYGNHIAREEEDILARAAQVLTAEDWEAVRTAAPAGPDALSGVEPDERYRALRRRIALEA